MKSCVSVRINYLCFHYQVLCHWNVSEIGLKRAISDAFVCGYAANPHTYAPEIGHLHYHVDIEMLSALVDKFKIPTMLIRLPRHKAEIRLYTCDHRGRLQRFENRLSQTTFLGQRQVYLHRGDIFSIKFDS